MLQQVIAIIIILYFLVKLYIQKRNKKISKNEFLFWVVFWTLAVLAILSIKWIDKIVANLGFSGSGIEILLYLSVVILIYFVFKLRLRLEKIEKDITKIVREISFINKKQ